MTNAYLSLGSNLGDARANIASAVEKLSFLGSVEAISSLYTTEPVGFADQPWFLNVAVTLKTDILLEELLQRTKGIEKAMGRTASVRNGPRLIDVDILLYGDAVAATAALTVPHPWMHERRFVLEPLAEIAPEAIHPLFKKTVAELCAECRDPHVVRKLGTLEE